MVDSEFLEYLATAESGVVDERQDTIERILTRLPGHLAAVLRLHYLERWPIKDIAAKTGDSLVAVRARLHRARAVFRKESQSSQTDSL